MLIEKINFILTTLIAIMIVAYFLYRLLYVLIYKMGRHEKLEEFSNDLKLKKFDSKEKQKLVSYYQDRELSASDLFLITISSEELEKKLQDGNKNIYLEINIGEQYLGILKCYLTLEKTKENSFYIVKNVDVKEIKSITGWQ